MVLPQTPEFRKAKPEKTQRQHCSLKGNAALATVSMEFNHEHASDFLEKETFAVKLSAISRWEQKPLSKSLSESCHYHLSPRTLTHNSHF